VAVPVVCLRCRRPLEPEDEDDVSLSLDGPVMLRAIRDERAAAKTDEDRELLDRFAEGLCPVCGRGL
jgi:hypothetical protein